MISYLRSTICRFVKNRPDFFTDTSVERSLAINNRKLRMFQIISAVGGTSQRLFSRLNHASDNAELDLIQAELYTFLARDRGETYAKEVLAGLVEPQMSGYVPLS